MKKITFILLTIILIGCNASNSDKNNAIPENNKPDSSRHVSLIDSNETTPVTNPEEDTIISDFATFYVVIADTSMDYYELHSKMFELHRRIDMPIDTMGRYYDESKNLIALSENEEDEIYTGDYFPRRFPSVNLSLEYLSSYKQNTREKMIALVTGIYDTEQIADSALAVLKKSEETAFKVEADIYIGCIH